MQEHTRTGLRRVLEQVDIEEIAQDVKRKIQDDLQGVKSPDEAFMCKLRLDAVDELILQLKQYAVEK